MAAVAVGVVLGTQGDDSSSGNDPTGVIEGTVATDGAPEAGVWVIAETESTPTPMRKIVVTDDAGRFVVPQLPDGDYEVWVRGYGLRDSAKVPATVGATVAMETETATPREAARIYPSNYWLSMYEPPDTSADWMTDFKLTCMLCHQFGSIPTRAGTTFEFVEAGLKKSNVMNAGVERLGGDEFIQSLADWGAKIEAGEIPAETPPRPQGLERNMVITQWDYGDESTYAHDEIATDKRDPTVNANGRVWGVDLGNDRLLWVDPNTNETGEYEVPTRDGFDTRGATRRSRSPGWSRAARSPSSPASARSAARPPTAPPPSRARTTTRPTRTTRCSTSRAVCG